MFNPKKDKKEPSSFTPHDTSMEAVLDKLWRIVIEEVDNN